MPPAYPTQLRPTLTGRAVLYAIARLVIAVALYPLVHGPPRPGHGLVGVARVRLLQHSTDLLSFPRSRA